MTWMITRCIREIVTCIPADQSMHIHGLTNSLSSSFPKNGSSERPILVTVNCFQNSKDPKTSLYSPRHMHLI